MIHPAKGVSVPFFQSLLAMGLLLAFASGSPCAPAQVTQRFDRPTSSGLKLGTQFFEPAVRDVPTTLPVTSVVMDETSNSVGAVTVAGERETSQPAAPVMTPVPQPTSPEQANLNEQQPVLSGALPVKVDKSSTAAQTQQLARFERRNQIGEAFLLAMELVKQNPDAEFACDAAIRTSLVLGRADDIEHFYKEAIRQAKLPGKYYVQLAHYYQRNSRIDDLQKLISDYAKTSSNASDYRITLARLFAVAGDKSALKALFDKQGFNDHDIFPLLQLQIGAYSSLGLDDKATTIIMSAAARDFGMPENRLLLEEMLKLQRPKAEHISTLFQASLANETNYERARGVADDVIDRALTGRYFPALQDYLTTHAAQKKLSDMQRWLLALMERKAGNTTQSLETLTAESAGNTPVIAYERALALAQANRQREAIPTLQTLLAEQPDEINIRLSLAEQLLHEKRTTDSLRILNAINPEDLKNVNQVRYASVMISSLLQSHDGGRLLDAWVDLNSHLSFDAHQAMGDTLVRQVSNPAFRSSLADAALARIAKNPNEWSLYLLLARLSAANNEPRAELDFYNKYLDSDRDNVPMLRFVAELALQHATVPISLGLAPAKPGEKSHPGIALRASENEGTAEAVQYYRRLIELQPRLPENYSALMRAYQLRGEIETAKKVAIEYVDRGTSSAQACADAANMLAENGFDDDALLFYRTSVLKDPQNYDTLMHYASTLREVKKYGPAAEILKHIMEEGLHGVPYNQPEVFSGLLSIAQDSGDTVTLASYLDSLQPKPIPGKPEFYMSSTKLLLQLGDTTKAEQFLLDFQKEFPDNKYTPDSLLLLGQLQYMRQDTDDCRDTFVKVVDKFSTAPAAITAAFNIAELDRQSGKVEKAIATWEALSQAHSDNDKALAALYTAAMAAYTDLNDPARARQLFEDFIASGSQDFPMIRKARSNLERMSRGQPPLPEDDKG